MSKIKINLTSGSILEKPLVTCFKNASGTYLILDNEANGTMGYPIICISKFNGQSAEKIIDQGEWTNVKESLKTIISGTNLPYENVPETITAADDFFTQLTLPVASFELLKNVYNVPQPAPQPATPVVENVAPAVEKVEEPAPIVTPSIPTPETVSPMPQIAQMTIETPTPVQPMQIPTPEAPVVSQSVIEPVDPAVETTDEMAVIKETFMKSCENMFDALVKKFQNK